MRQPRLRTVLISTGAALALTAGSTTAYAAVAGGPVDSSGVIHGCWTNTAINGTHVFVLQDAGTNCPKGTTAISWNQQGPAGPAGPAGATGPAGPKGNPGAQGPPGPAGDTGPAGPQGPQGPQGQAGADGSTVLNGSGAPADTLGNDSDFYLDTQADILYGPKAGGTWPTPGTSLVGNPGATGPAGPAGPAGLAGPAGPAGANGNTVLNGSGAPADSLGNDGDFYLDTAADVLYGPKSGGSWPATGTSLVGPAGPAGAPGAGATVTPLSSGDSHCGNGGAAITDGNGNTAYVCTGAAGPAGPAGAGTAGPSGLDLMTVTASAPLTGGTSNIGAEVSVQCPASHPYAVSGGGYFNDVSNEGPFLFVDAPLGSNGWFVQGFGQESVALPSNDELNGYVICSK